MKAQGLDVALWLVHRSEETQSPGMVQRYLQAVWCFRKNAGFTLGKIPLVSAVMKGLLKILDAKALNHLGFEPEMVQVIIKLSIESKGI